MGIFSRQKLKHRIAIDFDGTLLPTYEAIVAWSDKVDGTHYAPFKPNDWPNLSMKPISNLADGQLADRFFQDLKTHGLEPVSGSLEAIAQLERIAECVVVSSGTETQRTTKQQWLKQHFPGIKKLVFINQQGRYATKEAACRALKLELIIEDRYDYSAECAAAGIPAITLQRYAWSRGPDAPNLTKVVDWNEATVIALQLLEP